MGPVVLHLLILWVVLAIGLLAARQHRRGRTELKSGEFGDSLSFIAASFGLLLGLLVVFATTHYAETRNATQTEATAVVSLFDALDGIPASVGDPVQHDVVCYARSVVTDDWHQMEAGTTEEASRTVVAGDRLRQAIRALPDSESAKTAQTKITEAGAARQQLLFLTRPGIPLIVWVLIYLGAAVLVFLIASDLVGRRSSAVTGLACVVLMLSAVVGVLTTLDRPFSPLARVQPTALQDALTLLGAGREGAPYLRACP